MISYTVSHGMLRYTTAAAPGITPTPSVAFQVTLVPAVTGKRPVLLFCEVAVDQTINSGASVSIVAQLDSLPQTAMAVRRFTANPVTQEWMTPAPLVGFGSEAIIADFVGMEDSKQYSLNFGYTYVDLKDASDPI